jgi:leader peptidase (prepilin peptidase)/N-methyltransferase
MMTLWPILTGLIGGMIAGSFLATLVIRWPEQRTLAGRSTCDHCGHTLGPRELVPLVSAWMLRFRCGACGGRIDPIHWRMEAAAAVIGATSLLVSPDLAGAAGAVFGWLLLALAILDFRHYWLPDRLTFPLLGLGLLEAFALDRSALPDRLIGAAAGWAVLAAIAALFRMARGRDGLGGGDPKLLAAIGAWLGWASLPWVVLAASLLGLCDAGIRLVRKSGGGPEKHYPLGTWLAVAGYASWLIMTYL